MSWLGFIVAAIIAGSVLYLEHSKKRSAARNLNGACARCGSMLTQGFKVVRLDLSQTAQVCAACDRGLVRRSWAAGIAFAFLLLVPLCIVWWLDVFR